MKIGKFLLMLAFPIVMLSQNVTYDHISQKNTFILIIDKSGSMSGSFNYRGLVNILARSYPSREFLLW